MHARKIQAAGLQLRIILLVPATKPECQLAVLRQSIFKTVLVEGTVLTSNRLEPAPGRNELGFSGHDKGSRITCIFFGFFFSGLFEQYL
jgi:hypothetical protein